MVRCLMDANIDPTSKCAYCCVYCEDQCEFRCPLSERCKSEKDVFANDCENAFEE